MLKQARFFIALLGIVAALALVRPATPLQAQAKAKSESKATSEVDRAKEAAQVLTEVMNIPENAIPDELMARAHGIAVIPHVVKGAFGLGGQWGKGLMAQRRENGTWSAPAFVEIGGGSFGLQIGVQASDVVLVFTDESGIKGLLKGKLKLGADASATAGPVGRKAEVGTDVLLRSGVFAYSRSKGLFAGISLDGSVVSIDGDANRKVYGKSLTGEEILLGDTVKPVAAVEPFMQELKTASPAHVHVEKTSHK